MWLSILSIIGELLKFLFKIGTDWLDGNKERRKARAEVKKNEIDTAKTQRDLLMGINKYNRI